MVAALAKPGSAILASLTPEKCELMHAAIGVGGEYIELGIAYQNKDEENFIEEAGDILFYLQAACMVTRLEAIPDRIVRVDELENPYAENSLEHWMEAFVDTIKRHIFYEKPLDKAKLNSAVNGIVYHIDMEMEMMAGLRANDAVNANIEKLGKRYEAFQYSDEAATNRKDKEA